VTLTSCKSTFIVLFGFPGKLHQLAVFDKALRAFKLVKLAEYEMYLLN